MTTRKKDSKALLEVIGSKSGRPMGVPGWFGQAKPAGAAAPPAKPPATTTAPRPAPTVTAVPPLPAGSPVPAAKPAATTAVATMPAAASATKPAPVARPAGATSLQRPAAKPFGQTGPEQAVYTAGGRLRFSLSQTGAAVTAVVSLLLLAGVFWAGRASVKPAAGPMADRVPQRPEVSNVENRGGRAVPAPAGGGAQNGGTDVPADDAARLKGYRYLVIESGIMSRRDAAEIQLYLHRNGIDATIHQMPHTGMWMVKGLQPFPDAAKMTPAFRQQLADHVAQVERLGREYKKQGGKYLFRQSKDDDPYMILEK